MIEISYMDSMSGNPTCFDLRFPLREYISKNYFNNDKCIELNYYIDLFKKYGLLKEDKPVEMIWLQSYKCQWGDILFTMVYDEDYDLVSFAVENPKYCTEIAEKICDLIKKEKIEYDRDLRDNMAE